MSNSLRPRGPQHARLPCPSPSPRVCSTSVHCVSDAIQPSHPVALFSFTFNLLQHQSLFQWVGSCIRWPHCWSFSFSISLSNECSGFISFRVDWFDLLAVQGTLESSPTLQFFSSSPYLWSSSVHDSDYSHEIKRHLLLGRKVKANLDSILKSRDITLPTKVHLVKAMVFPVCADVRVGPSRKLSVEKLILLNYGVGEDSWEFLGLQGDQTSAS